jgi:hypothetical protein
MLRSADCQSCIESSHITREQRLMAAGLAELAVA